MAGGVSMFIQEWTEIQKAARHAAERPQHRHDGSRNQYQLAKAKCPADARDSRRFAVEGGLLLPSNEGSIAIVRTNRLPDFGNSESAVGGPENGRHGEM